MAELKLPELGENIETVDVSAVLVSVGDQVRLDQPVIEVETEKASLEVPSTFEGRVEKLLVSAGDKVAVGQVLLVGQKLRLRLEGEEVPTVHEEESAAVQTMGVANTTVVTILVGDIRNFTTLVRMAPAALLQESVARVFGRLEKAVVAHGGTVKEFQGDALFAFWEQGSTRNHAVEGCRAALDLHRLTEDLARDPSVWAVEGFPLEMDWALTTGLVAISGYGGENILGLSMVGESVVLAFRLEKLADESTGPIITCPDTRLMASDAFEFQDLGSREAKGFDTPKKIFALTGER